MEFINNQTPYKLNQEIEMVEFKKTYHEFVFMDPDISSTKQYLISLQNYKNTLLQIANNELKAVNFNTVLYTKRS